MVGGWTVARWMGHAAERQNHPSLLVHATWRASAFAGEAAMASAGRLLALDEVSCWYECDKVAM